MEGVLVKTERMQLKQLSNRQRTAWLIALRPGLFPGRAPMVEELGSCSPDGWCRLGLFHSGTGDGRPHV